MLLSSSSQIQIPNMLTSCFLITRKVIGLKTGSLPMLEGSSVVSGQGERRWLFTACNMLWRLKVLDCITKGYRLHFTSFGRPLWKLFIEQFSDWLFTLLYGGVKKFHQNFCFFNQHLIKMFWGKFCMFLWLF